jgi:hypothetical protein
MLSRVEANVESLLKVLIDTGGSGRPIMVLQMLPDVISIRVDKGSKLLLDGRRYL